MASSFGHLDPVLLVLGCLLALSTPLLPDVPWLSSQENILGQVRLRWQRGDFKEVLYGPRNVDCEPHTFL